MNLAVLAALPVLAGVIFDSMYDIDQIIAPAEFIGFYHLDTILLPQERDYEAIFAILKNIFGSGSFIIAVMGWRGIAAIPEAAL